MIRYKKNVVQIAIVISILICFGNSLIIHAKAQLAQVLIKHSWESRIIQGRIIKPWPWSDTWPVAKLVFPEQNKTLYVLSGGHGESLAFGPGLLLDAAKPEEDGTKIIASHRDTHFSLLKHFQDGHRVQLQDKNGNWKNYQFSQAEIIDTDKESWEIDESKETLHLVTCYPFDAAVPGGPLRYIAIAEEIKKGSANKLSVSH